MNTRTNPFLNPNYHSRPDVQKKHVLVKQAYETLEILNAGTYQDAQDFPHDLQDFIGETALYNESSSLLADWATGPRLATNQDDSSTTIEFVHAPVPAVARALDAALVNGSVGVLHEAHAKKAGGAFTHGGEDPESALLRSSTLDLVLRSRAAADFFTGHRRDDRGGMNTHRFLYSPVALIRDQSGALAPPVQVGVVSAAPVNAQKAKGPAVERTMRERMARCLRLFEERGHTALVLGTFGGEGMQHSVESLACAWADLLAVEGAPFRGKFAKVVFAVPGRQMRDFQSAFEMRVYDDELTRALSE